MHGGNNRFLSSIINVLLTCNLVSLMSRGGVARLDSLRWLVRSGDYARTTFVSRGTCSAIEERIIVSCCLPAKVFRSFFNFLRRPLQPTSVLPWLDVLDLITERILDAEWFEWFEGSPRADLTALVLSLFFMLPSTLVSLSRFRSVTYTNLRSAIQWYWNPTTRAGNAQGADWSERTIISGEQDTAFTTDYPVDKLTGIYRTTYQYLT